jgi:hypothetical protein
MKKILLLLNFSLVTYFSSAQIAKEHAFDDPATIGISVITLENSGQKTCVLNKHDSTTYACVLYNTDYSEFKTISIDLESHFVIPDFNYPSLSISYITENVFDQDNEIEILAQLSYYDENDDEYAQVLVLNENGSTLFESDIENSNAWLFNSSAANSTIRSSLTNTEAGAKMILDVYYFNEGLYSYDVYDLPGSLPTSSKELKALEETQSNYLRAFPVPAHEFVDMEYQLSGDQKTGEIEIIDGEGKTIQKIRVENNRGMVRVPVSQYSNGVYIYKLNTKRGIPRTGKVMIMNQE